MNNTPPFIQVPEAIVSKAAKFDKDIWEFKKDYNVQNYFNTQSHFFSKLAEWIFASRFGLEDQISWNLQHHGDEYDFKIGDLTIDVKSTTYWQAPEIKCFPDENKTDIYVLVALIPELNKGRLVGWCDKSLLFNPTNYRQYRRLGLRYWLTEKQLSKDWSVFKPNEKEKTGEI